MSQGHIEMGVEWRSGKPPPAAHPPPAARRPLPARSLTCLLARTYLKLNIHDEIFSAAHYFATALTEVCFHECVILEASEDHLIVSFEGFGATFTQKVQT